MAKVMLILVSVLFVTPDAFAQSYTIQRPGQLPTYVRPNSIGGATVDTPGQLPTYITPNYGGGYTEYVARTGQEAPGLRS